MTQLYRLSPITKEIVPEDNLLVWSRWFDDIENRRIAYTILNWDTPECVTISTVFLGMNMGYLGEPKYFETMVFGGEMDNYIRRYETMEEAVDGHAEIVRAVKLTIRYELKHGKEPHDETASFLND